MQRESWMTSSHQSVADHNIHRGPKGRERSTLASLVDFRHHHFPQAIGNDTWQAEAGLLLQGHAFNAWADRCWRCGSHYPPQTVSLNCERGNMVFPGGPGQSKFWQSLPLTHDAFCPLPSKVLCCHFTSWETSAQYSPAIWEYRRAGSTSCERVLCLRKA